LCCGLFRLCRNELGVGGGKFLAEFIPHNSTLRRLDIIENHIGEAGTRKIAEALADGSALEEIYGIDLSPYAQEYFFIEKEYTYEYGNIKLLQHLKTVMPLIAIEKEKIRLAEEEAAQAERERLERERAEEEERKRLANRSSFANITSGALGMVGGMFGGKKKEKAELTEWHKSMDYDGEDSDEENADQQDMEAAGQEEEHQEEEETPPPEPEEKPNKKEQSKLAKSLKFWGS